MNILFILPPPAERTAEWRNEYLQALSSIPALCPPTDDLAAILATPNAEPLFITMNTPPTAATQIIAIHRSLVPRFLDL